MDNTNWKKTRVIYWSDELNDDFNPTLKKRPEIAKKYKYKRNPFIAFISYYLFAKPIMWLYCFFHGVRVEGKYRLKSLKKTGYIIYANHVAIADAFKFPSYVIHDKRVNIIGYSDALSLKGLCPILKGLGYLPIPNDINHMHELNEEIGRLLNKKEVILIYPEAHIWPYYTKIRNFKSASFIYPAEFHKPIVPAVTIWRGKANKKPKQTVVFGRPIYPDPDLSPLENKQYLHDQCLLAMQEIVRKHPQVEYIKYIQVEKETPKDI